ncbi:hypothetical protein V3O24_04550 [Methylobacter sp. Wu8]|uniref:hypothetical protein n=1 Tax=Methylobacter sp. Wu8 TaxID=3118457 RepID=UPI002F2BD53C
MKMVFKRSAAVVLLLFMASVAHAEQLNDKNINQFLLKYANDYATHSMRLVRGFRKYKDQGDYQGFVAFKNTVWLPEFERDRKAYDAILEDNRKYLFDNGMTFIFSNLVGLGIYANNFFFDLRRGDKNIRKATVEKMQTDMNQLETLFKEKSLEFKPLVRD